MLKYANESDTVNLYKTHFILKYNLYIKLILCQNMPMKSDTVNIYKADFILKYNIYKSNFILKYANESDTVNLYIKLILFLNIT